MDCFAEALTREGGSPLSLVERLNLLGASVKPWPCHGFPAGLGADSTWRPLPCDEDERGYLWAPRPFQVRSAFR